MDMIATTNCGTPGTNVTNDGLSGVVPQVNGVLKRHQKSHQHVVVAGAAAYKECLKNHAASMGGHAVDGCGEFMPSQTATATDPTSLKCAACGCHRNFHRRDGVLGSVTGARVVEYHPQHRHHPPPPSAGAQSPGSDNHSPPPISSTYFPTSAPHMLLALSSGGGGNGDDDSPKMNANNNQNNANQQMLVNSHSSPNFSSRKRFRTKFTQEQKDKMQEFAEKLGWKMQKSTDELVKGFCASIGVQREVFKVWMHNNKNTFNKRPPTTTSYIVSSANHDARLTTLNNININSNHNINSSNLIMKEDYENVDGNGVGNSHSSSVNNSESIEGGAPPHHHHHLQQRHHHQFINNGRTPTNASSSSS
ncbi:hypothetical protein vseg_001938 [Gypsophila vaccaria]